MTDRDCTDFLQWSLPQLHLRWSGFRKVRRQICRRISKRLQELGLKNTEEYRSFLEEHDGEWSRLDSFCRITISRFYRDRGVFLLLEHEVFPTLARSALFRGDSTLTCWSIGCASGEEPYTLALLWDLEMASRFPSLFLSIVASDADATMVERAKKGCYDMSSLKDLPRNWISSGFERKGGRFCIHNMEKARVTFLVQDIRRQEPPGSFDLVFCRNLVLTYFDENLQRDLLRRLSDKLKPEGFLVTGIHENLPAGFSGFSARQGVPGVFRKH